MPVRKQAQQKRDNESNCPTRQFRGSSVPAQLCSQLTEVHCNVAFDTVCHNEVISTQKKSCNDGNNSVLLLFMQSTQSFDFFIIASILSRKLNTVAESPCYPRLNSDEKKYHQDKLVL